MLAHVRHQILRSVAVVITSLALNALREKIHLEQDEVTSVRQICRIDGSIGLVTKYAVDKNNRITDSEFQNLSNIVVTLADG